MEDATRMFIGGQLDGAVLIFSTYQRRYTLEEEIYRLAEKAEDILQEIKYSRTGRDKKKKMKEVGDIRLRLAEKYEILARKHTDLADRSKRLANNSYKAAQYGFKKYK